MCDLCVLLCLDDQLCGQQALSLILRNVRTVDNIGDELRSEGQRQIVAVDVTRFLLVYEEEVVAGLFHCHIGVLADFDISLGTENEKTAITPCSQAIWREPVETYISQTLVATQHHIAKILKARMLRMSDIGNLRGNNFGFGRASVVQELIDLMRADIAEN